ncbi:efflux RND transporter periplasmic adaptor subunit [bacterium]|nr:efflux RND transporter periplasmic adaptor subunit [bacterium]
MKHLILTLPFLLLISCATPDRPENAAESASPAGEAAAEAAASLTLTAEEVAAMDLMFSDVELREAEKTISVPARVIEDPDRSAAVTALIDGRMERVLARQGQRVAKGQVLAVMVSMQLGDMIADLLRSESAKRTAEAAASRLRSLNKSDAASQKQLQESEHALQSARAEAAAALQRLRAAGMTANDIKELREQPEQFEPVLKLRAPIAGVVSSRTASIGQPVSPGVVLFNILGTESALIEGSVFEDNFQLLGPQQKAVFVSEAIPGKRFEGSITYIAPTVDDASHALPVRCTVPNSSGMLKPNVYGRLDILTTARDSVLTVPLSSIVYDGSDRSIFIALDADRFTYRRVETGREFDDRVEILNGVAAGDRVVSGGVFHLKSRYKLALAPEEE